MSIKRIRQTIYDFCYSISCNGNFLKREIDLDIILNILERKIKKEFLDEIEHKCKMNERADGDKIITWDELKKIGK